ncbi:sensor histidine kinase [Streptomyces sp. NBC_00690]|uniref:sensor histidine kinase n=1 Tax=Streptomyces sp. NBC_00690 TaxID=2975808 RepID=UPI002E2854DF|nr:ATP-binding protein [Streptomyces sp. NBC_00690]
MSPQRAPTTRSDGRESGRHGRSSTRSAPAQRRSRPLPLPPESHIRPRLLRTAVLPALVAALSGATAVTYTVHSAAPRPTPALWAVLTGTAALAIAAVAVAALGADRMAASVLGRCAHLRRSIERGQEDLRQVVERLRRGERPPAARAPQPRTLRGDEFDLVTRDLSRSHDAAVAAVVQASQLSSSVGNEQKVEVFVNLARRLQSLVHREIQLLDELENEVEDPELLKGLFHVDHLATRIRRHAENLAVLGGAISRRQWSHPVTMTEVLRSAIAEVEHYPRVKLVPPIDGTMRGHAVADVIHLVAELVENATVFSAPHTQVLLRAQHVTAGLAVEVEDRGLGMPTEEQDKMNALLADPDQVNVAHLLQDGRIGLFVVSALARRHGIAVRLQSNIYGGIQATIVLPQGLLGTEPGGLQQSDPVSGRTRRRRKPPTTITTSPPSIPDRPQTAPKPVQQQAPQLRPLPQQTPRSDAHPPPVAAVPRTPEPPRPQQPAHSSPALAPLPVRAEHVDRPNPAAARPGANYTTRKAAAPVADRSATITSAPTGVVRGTMGRPQLPKRRSQEHIAPQLKMGPPPRKEDEAALHDPGLMAAFQRGIGLAEAQPLKADLDPGTAAPTTTTQRHDNTSKE